jgi:hypothetical protein
VKLHTKLGKPIPSTDPVLVTTTGTVTVAKGGASTVSSAGKPAAKATTSVAVVKKVISAPKITFVGRCPSGFTSHDAFDYSCLVCLYATFHFCACVHEIFLRKLV